jgi:hypothetical protein
MQTEGSVGGSVENSSVQNLCLENHTASWPQRIFDRRDHLRQRNVKKDHLSKFLSKKTPCRLHQCRHPPCRLHQTRHPPCRLHQSRHVAVLTAPAAAVTLTGPCRQWGCRHVHVATCRQQGWRHPALLACRACQPASRQHLPPLH